MRSTSFVLVVMACYSPHVHEGSPCTTDDGCPSGQMCYDNVCTSSDPSCQCSGSALACAGGNEPCALGCIDAPQPHCALVAPSNMVDPASASGLTSTITIDGSAVFDGDTGTVTGVDGTVPYSLAGSLAVFSFHGLAITQTGSVRLAGSHPIAFLVDGDATIDGVIDGGAGCGSGDLLDNRAVSVHRRAHRVLPIRLDVVRRHQDEALDQRFCRGDQLAEVSLVFVDQHVTLGLLW